MTDHSTPPVDPYYSSPEWIALRTRVVQMNKHVCAYCTASDGYQADHVIPRHLGGADDISNLVACCARCNKVLGGKAFDSFADKKAWLLTELKRIASEKKHSTAHPTLCAYKRISKVRGCPNLTIPGSSYCHGHHYLILSQRADGTAPRRRKKRR